MGFSSRRAARSGRCGVMLLALAALLGGAAPVLSTGQPGTPAAGAPEPMEWGAGVQILRASAAQPPGAVPSSAFVPFTERFRALQHGGIVRAANSAITCTDERAPGAVSCARAQRGTTARNSDYAMFYIDIDDDPNTYNSSSARLDVPEGARITYARLYWGGNLRVGEQKPPEDNARVLFAEPGGQYKEVLADTVIGHRVTAMDDAFTASADVTDLIRHAERGHYTVAQLNVAMGHSAAGAWGGWTLVAAYEHPDEPLRDLVLWDGFETLEGRDGLRLTADGLGAPPGAAGRLGLVGYDGDPGTSGDTVHVDAGPLYSYRLEDDAHPGNDLMNSTISDLGSPVTTRRPAYRNTLGYDSSVFDVSPALVQGADHVTLRLAAGTDRHHLAAVFLQADARA